MYRRFTLLCCLLALVSCKQYSTVTETRPIFRPTATTTGALGATPAYLVKALTEESNRLFGRRFVITSFRWLSPEEV